MDRATDEAPTILGVSASASFIGRLASVANSIGVAFENIGHLEAWENLPGFPDQLCIVVDYDSPDVFNASNLFVRLREVLALIVIVPPGDSDATFHANCMGAIKTVPCPVDWVGLTNDFQKLFASLRLDSTPPFPAKSKLVEQYCQLSDREVAILRLLMRGEPNNSVAAQLNLGLRIVESDRANMMRTFEVKTFAQLIQQATIALEHLRLTRARALSG